MTAILAINTAAFNVYKYTDNNIHQNQTHKHYHTNYMVTLYARGATVQLPCDMRFSVCQEWLEWYIKYWYIFEDTYYFLAC